MLVACVLDWFHFSLSRCRLCSLSYFHGPDCPVSITVRAARTLPPSQAAKPSNRTVGTAHRVTALKAHCEELRACTPCHAASPLVLLCGLCGPVSRPLRAQGRILSADSHHSGIWTPVSGGSAGAVAGGFGAVGAVVNRGGRGLAVVAGLHIRRHPTRGAGGW